MYLALWPPPSILQQRIGRAKTRSLVIFLFFFSFFLSYFLLDFFFFLTYWRVVVTVTARQSTATSQTSRPAAVRVNGALARASWLMSGRAPARRHSGSSLTAASACARAAASPASACCNTASIFRPVSQKGRRRKKKKMKGKEKERKGGGVDIRI